MVFFGLFIVRPTWYEIKIVNLPTKYFVCMENDKKVAGTLNIKIFGSKSKYLHVKYFHFKSKLHITTRNENIKS